MAYITDPVARARARAKAARLYPRSTAIAGQFLVRSRTKNYDHVVSVTEGIVVACTGCLAFEHRNVCIHMGAVLNRLERERRVGSPRVRPASRWTDPLRV